MTQICNFCTHPPFIRGSVEVVVKVQLITNQIMIGTLELSIHTLESTKERVRVALFILHVLGRCLACKSVS